jgi:hypothetical protein
VLIMVWKRRKGGLLYHFFCDSLCSSQCCVRFSTNCVALTLQNFSFCQMLVVLAFCVHTSRVFIPWKKEAPLNMCNTETKKKKKNRLCANRVSRPQLMCDYPLNLSILIRGGKETNRDSLSSGERNGISSSRRIIGLIVYWSVPCKGGSIILHI